MTEKTYFGFLLRQRIANETVAFFVFQARAKDIQKWAGIRRVSDHPNGTQRPYRESRARAIMRYLKADNINTIPNSVLLAFQPETTEFTSLNEELKACFQTNINLLNGCEGQTEWGMLTFSYSANQPEHERIAFIVDGQHRLNGMYEFANEDLPVVIISLVDAPLKEQAFQFIVVNNKAVRVPTESAKSIVAELDDKDEQELGFRLFKAGIKYKDVSPVLRDINDMPNSAFHNLLHWDYNRDGSQLVPLTAIEQSLKYLKTLFAFLDEDEDSLLEIFLAIWLGVKQSYPNLWGQDNVLMKKVSLNALNEFIGERLKMAWEFGLLDIFDPERVSQQVEQIMASIPEQFWIQNWNIAIQDNANVRELIQGDLKKITENKKLRKQWHEDLYLVNNN
jgi:DGQHR domain-containing protein